MRAPFAALALCTATLATVSAQSTAVDVTRLGPQVGEPVPSFTLPDQNGQPTTLASIFGPNGAMLVFFRSADW